MGSAYYVYAIVRRDTPLPPVGGAGDVAGLALVPCRELAAVTGPLGDDGGPRTVEAVLRHEAVVEAVRRQGPALPVRFGTVFRDATSLAAALARRYEPLAGDLDRLGDKVELCLTALWMSPPAEGVDSGTGPETGRGRSAGARYLRARVAELRREDELHERAEALARALDEVLGGLALERRVSLLPTPRIALRTAYLLDAAGVGAFRSTFETIRRGEELRLLLTGPWPPYSFVNRAETEGAPAGGGRLAELAQLLTDTMRTRNG